MSQFTNNISIAPLPKKNKRITTSDVCRYISDKLTGEKITIPRGFEFDGASVPMVFGMFIQRVEPKSISSALLHDRLYLDGRRGTRSEVDRMFLESLKANRVGFIKRWIMRLGVRMGGRLYRYKLI